MGAAVLRVLIGLAGVLALLVAARTWMAPEAMGAQLGLSGDGPLGLASLRADIGGFFAAGGAFALAAAIRNQARLLTPPLVLLSIALCGRLLSFALNGTDAASLPPAAIEAVLVLLFGIGRRVLPAR
ncbi:MAG: hypothetical protein R3C52_08560 [Hyphomonadaceae bacterium]